MMLLKWTSFLILCVTFIQCEKLLRFANCNCVVNNEYLNLTACNLKALSREKVVTNVDFFMLKNVTNATIHLAVFKATSTGRYFPYLVDYWGNVCDAVSERQNANFILKQTKRIMAKYSNAVKCFHKADFYYFRNLEIEYRSIKNLLDNGRYMVKIDFYEGNQDKLISLGNYTAYFYVSDLQPQRRRAKKEKVMNFEQL